MTSGPAPISKGEKWAVAVWAVLMVLIVAAPIWHGHQETPEGWEYLGFSGSFQNDYQSYLAWMRQATDGHFLFRDQFTTEPHDRVFFHPLFWIMGTTTRVTGLPLMAVWYAVQLLGVVLLVVAIYRFAAQFTDYVATRLLALVLSTTASGLGWAGGFRGKIPSPEWAIDVWMPEANQFLALVTSFFTLTIGLALMLLAMVHMLRYYRSGRLREAAIGGAYALALAATHQYDMVTLYAVLGVWTLMAGWRFLRGLALLVAISVPYGIYSLGIIKLNPVLSRVTWEMPVPTISAHLIGFGLPLALGLGALLIPAIRERNRGVLRLGVWLGLTVVLLLIPIGFQRKLIWGVHVACSLLAAMGVIWLLGRLAARLPEPRDRSVLRGVGAVAVVVVCAIGSAQFYEGLFTRNRQHLFYDYIPGSYADAITWLDEHSDPGEVVVAEARFAAMLPGRIGATVFMGHWAQTIAVKEKNAIVTALFYPSPVIDLAAVQRILERNRVRYIVVDQSGAALVERTDLRNGLVFEPITTLVYESPSVTIWEVKGYRPGSATEAWASGDWRGDGL